MKSALRADRSVNQGAQAVRPDPPAGSGAGYLQRQTTSEDMNFLLLPFVVLSVLGLLLSIASHIAALLGLTIPGGSLVWGLHLGIFVVWLPTVLVANRMARHGKRSDFWKLALSGCPAWARYALYGLFGYAVINFTLGISTTVGLPKGPGMAGLASEVRLFSGHWMVFYGAAFATLYSAIKNPQLLKGRQCAQGHDVSPLDQFCPRCGAALQQPVPGSDLY